MITEAQAVEADRMKILRLIKEVPLKYRQDLAEDISEVICLACGQDHPGPERCRCWDDS